MKLNSSIIITTVLFLPSSNVFGHWMMSPCNTSPFGLIRRQRPMMVSNRRFRHYDPILRVYSDNPFVVNDTDMNLRSNEFHETDDAYELVIDVPGIKAEDISVQVEDDGNVLRIQGERTVKSKDGTSISTSKFHKAYGLEGESCDVDAIEVTLDSGVLSVHIPKIKKEETEEEDSSTRTIPVKDIQSLK